MKRRFLHIFLVAMLALCLVLGLAACTTDSGEVTLDKSTLTLYEGGSVGSITASLSQDATGKVEWTNSDSTVIEITPSEKVCVVKPKAAGTATVTATLGKSTATCTVTVNASETVAIMLNGNNVTDTTVEVEEHGTLSFTATTSKGSAVTWTSSNEQVATVDNNGTVTALKFGETTITARINTYYYSTVTVKVNLPAGTEYYDLQFAAEGATEDSEGNPITTDKYFYWSAKAEWQQQEVVVEYAYYRDGSLSFKYTSNWDPGYSYGFQLVYKNSAHTLYNYYKLSCTIEIDQDCMVNLNGNDIHLNKGTNNVVVYYQYTDPLGSGNTYGVSSFDLVMGVADGTATGSFVKDAEVTVSDIAWEDDVRVQLQAPSFTYDDASGVITITDPNEEGVGGYRLNLYKDDGSLATAIPVENGQKVDTSEVENGTYTAKLMAYAENTHYINSDVSATEATIVVANEHVRYQLSNTGASGAWNTPGKWTYWTENWVTFSGEYLDGEVTVTFENNSGNWYDTQLFYTDPSAEANRAYTVTLTITSSAAGRVTFNDQVINLQEGTHDYTVEGYVQHENASTIIVVFGVVNESNLQEIKAGTVSLKIKEIIPGEMVTPPTPPTPGGDSQNPEDYELGEPMNPTDTAMEKGEEPSLKDDVLTYWFVEDTSWNCGSVVTMTTATYQDGVVTLVYTGGDLGYSVQLFYKNTQLKVGTKYFVFLTLELSEDLSVTVNNSAMDLKAGTHQLHVLFEEGAMAGGTKLSSLDIQFHGAGEKTVTVKVSEVSWREVLGEEEEQPSTPTGDPVAIPTEPNGEVNFGEDGFDDSGAPKSVLSAPDKMYYWNDQWWCGSNVTVSEHKIEDGVYTFTYSGMTTACTFGFQLFYKASNHITGNSYKLLLKINSSVAGDIRINGEVKSLIVGDNQIEVTYVEPNTASISIQFGVDEPKSVIESGTFKFSEIKFVGQVSGQQSGGEDSGEVRTINVTATDFYAGNFVKISVSPEDFEFINTNAAYVKTNGVRYGHNDNKGFLPDGDKFQIQFNEGDTKFVCEWYDAQDKVIAKCEFAKESAVTPGGGGSSVPGEVRTINVTSTDFYAGDFVKIGMSTEDLQFLNEKAAYVKTNGERYGHNGNKGFLVDGTVIQVQFKEGDTEFSCEWYDAEDNLIATCTFEKAN